MGLFGAKNPEAKPSDSPVAAQAPQKGPTPQTASQAPATRPSGCVVGAQTQVKGDLTGDEDILVEGTVEGEIRITRTLRVGPTGRVKATVQALSIVVSGEIQGDCTASERVELQATARLIGNIRAPRIVIAEGALFKGSSDMTARTETAAVRPV